MVKKKKGLEMVMFKLVKGYCVPLKPWPQVFYITQYMIMSHECEVRPLTVTGLFKGITKNFITMSWWRMCYLFYRIGFINIPEGERYSFKYWRWDFWNVRKERKNRRNSG